VRNFLIFYYDVETEEYEHEIMEANSEEQASSELTDYFWKNGKSVFVISAGEI
jgi:hypothetical protein